MLQKDGAKEAGGGGRSAQGRQAMSVVGLVAAGRAGLLKLVCKQLCRALIDLMEGTRLV